MIFNKTKNTVNSGQKVQTLEKVLDIFVFLIFGSKPSIDVV